MALVVIAAFLEFDAQILEDSQEVDPITKLLASRS